MKLDVFGREQEVVRVKETWVFLIIFYWHQSIDLSKPAIKYSIYP